MLIIKEGTNICGISHTMSVAINKTRNILDKWSVDMVITSAFRNKQANIAAGGLPTSKHRYGMAIDIRIRDMEKPRIIRDELARELVTYGYQVVLEKDHIHIEYDDLV